MPEPVGKRFPFFSGLALVLVLLPILLFGLTGWDSYFVVSYGSKDIFWACGGADFHVAQVGSLDWETNLGSRTIYYLDGSRAAKSVVIDLSLIKFYWEENEANAGQWFIYNQYNVIDPTTDPAFSMNWLWLVVPFAGLFIWFVLRWLRSYRITEYTV